MRSQGQNPGWVVVFRKELAIPLFDLTTDLLQQAMLGSSARQAALANNVANANTPGYQRQDVDFHSALAQALDSPSILDSPSATDRVEQTDFAPVPTPTGVVGQDGNTVDIDREMASLTQNSLEYQSLTSIMHTRLSLIQIAIGTRSS
jgi:flagellar basal-body rod protein FlgB